MLGKVFLGDPIKFTTIKNHPEISTVAGYTSRGHKLRFFAAVIFVPVCCLNRSAIAGLLSRFKQQNGAKRTRQKPQFVTARSIEPRPKKLSTDKALLAIQLYEARQHSIQQICSLVGVSKPTLYKYLKHK